MSMNIEILSFYLKWSCIRNVPSGLRGLVISERFLSRTELDQIQPDSEDQEQLGDLNEAPCDGPGNAQT